MLTLGLLWEFLFSWTENWLCFAFLQEEYTFFTSSVVKLQGRERDPIRWLKHAPHRCANALVTLSNNRGSEVRLMGPAGLPRTPWSRPASRALSPCGLITGQAGQDNPLPIRSTLSETACWVYR